MCPEIFWRKIDKNGPIPKACPELGPCWLWTGCTNKSGYGVTSVAHRFISTHRLAYIYEFGEIPDDLLVCHHCDVPNCCRPSHFFLGTNRDNSSDMVQKNRQSQGASHAAAILPNRPRGSKNAMSRFTEEQVSEMRRLRKETNMTLNAIATKFGASYGGVQKAINGEGWKHISEAPVSKHFTKHSQGTIDAVRAARASGKLLKELVQEFGLSINTINNIVYERTRRISPPSP